MKEHITEVTHQIEELRQHLFDAYQLAEQIRDAFSRIEPPEREIAMKTPLNEIRKHLYAARNQARALPGPAQLEKILP